VFFKFKKNKITTKLITPPPPPPKKKKAAKAEALSLAPMPQNRSSVASERAEVSQQAHLQQVTTA
jgi:hypothetical protein